MKRRTSPFDPTQAQNMMILLTELLKTGGPAHAGSLKFLKVSDLADSPSLNDDFVLRCIETTLQKLIVPPNIFFRQSEDTFAVVFLRQDKKTADAISRKCRRAILNRLESKHDITNFRVAVEIREITHEALAANPNAVFPGSSADDVGAASRRSADADIDICYRPVWHATKGVIANYLTTLRLKRGDGRLDYGYSVLPDIDDLVQVAAVDRMMLQASARILEGGIKAGKTFAVTTPADCRVLADRDMAQAYFGELAKAPPTTTKRLCIEVVGLKSTSIDGDVLGNLEVLSKSCRQLLLHLPITADGFDGLKDAPIAAVGTSAYGMNWGLKESEGQLRYFAAAMRKFRKPLYLTGLSDAHAATIATEIGFEYLAGPLIGPELKKPKHVRSVRFREIQSAARAKAA